jgi:hypothetical protein
MNIRESILNSIVKLQDKKTKEFIPITKKNILFENSKYSSTKDNIWHLIINDIKIRKSSEYIITYICNDCNTENTVGTTQILRKIRRGTTKCLYCQLNELNKKPDHNKPKFINNDKCYINNNDFTKEVIREKSIIEFESYNDIYKNSYFLSHLTEDDYRRIRKNIISFCNGKYTELDNYDFWSIYKVNNQMRFSSVLYDKVNKCIFKANQPIMKCDNCEKEWRCKSLEGLKNSYKILCPDCKLCNRTFKIRPTKNINNQTIIYQSKLELKFIEWCNNNNIIVNNGPNIDYIFNGKSKKYRVDFQIGDILIEIKDFHIWHKNQVESGLWNEKLNAVNKFISENCLQKYIFITPQNWNQMIKELLNCIC